MEKPKVLKGFLQKRGPKEYHGWKRRWFVLENNLLTYYKEQNDTEPVAAMHLEHATSLHRNSDVAPKKLEQCSFAIDIKEHKQVRTYYLSAYSEGEKKQWLDAMLASKKWYAAQAQALLTAGSAKPAAAGAANKSAPVAAGNSAKLEQELEEAETKIRKLTAENKQLKQKLDEKSKGGNHEEMLLELEEMEERFEQEKKKRIALEKQLAGNSGKAAGMVDEAELEALKDKYEEEIRFLKSQHQRDLRLSVKGKGPAPKKADSGDEEFDVPDFEDSYDDDVKSPRGGKSPKAPAKGNSDALAKEIEVLKKENAKLKAAPGKAAAVKSADVEDLEEEIAELNGLVQKLSQDVSNLQADKADLEKELQKAQSGKGGGGGNQAKLQEENEGLRNQMEDLERHLDELEATIASKNKTIRELETKVKAGGGGGGKGGAETEELKKKLQLMEGVLEDLEQEIQDLKQENEALNDRLASKGGGGDSSRLEEELIEAQNQASQYKAKLGLLRAEYKKLLSQQKK